MQFTYFIERNPENIVFFMSQEGPGPSPPPPLVGAPLSSSWKAWNKLARARCVINTVPVGDGKECQNPAHTTYISDYVREKCMNAG